MKPINLEIDGISIVLLGNFNPMIFQPLWFAIENLVSRKDAKIVAQNKETVLHPDFVSYSMENWSLQITRDRFKIETIKQPFELVRDLVSGTFKILRHTPISAMGINRDMHIRISPHQDINQKYERIAPSELWGKSVDEPSFQSLTISGIRSDKYAGYIKIRVEPSKRSQNAIFVGVNDHYQIEDNDDTFGCDKIINIFDDQWSDSIARALSIGDRITKG